jgi:uncharacterized protein with GYD domain
MPKFVFFGNYTSKAMEGMSAERTRQANSLVEKFGGEITAGYALLGETDLVFIGSFPSIEKAMQASVAVSKLTNITFTTAPAVSIEEFDKLVEEM